MRIAIGAFILFSGVSSLVWAGFGQEKEASIKGSLPTQGLKASDFPSLAKVSQQEAVNIALGQAPGKVLETELENEDGFLVYAIEIATKDAGVREVLVDAGNGKVLASTAEDSKDSADADGPQGDSEDEESDDD